PAAPRQIAPAGMKLSTNNPPAGSSSGPSSQNRPLDLGIFSPIDQNGCFEFDRVIKSGENWRTIYLVLRPNTLSIYKDRDGTKLRHQIVLSEITAIARQRDPKRKANHVFGVFSPSRNYHMAALSDQDAHDWVEFIRREARIDEEEQEMILASPSGGNNTFRGFGREKSMKNLRRDIVSSSSESEPAGQPRSSARPIDLHSARRQSHTVAYSGTEAASYSDFSDTGLPNSFRDSTLSNARPHMPRSTSQMSVYGTTTSDSSKSRDDERVISQGWLYILKSKGGMRQWKKMWCVLRPKSVGFYKNDDEYSATLIIPFSSIINAVDVDPISKSKRFCLQLISEERNYRLCAPDEDALAKWLGAFKMLLAKRKEATLQR
ncbi:PH-domain-containing protein, partial [Saccharata proteae CBS 121410]